MSDTDAVQAQKMTETDALKAKAEDYRTRIGAALVPVLAILNEAVADKLNVNYQCGQKTPNGPVEIQKITITTNVEL